MSDTPKNLVYAKAGQKHGPLAPGELKALAARGGLSASDLVWKEGLPSWFKAGDIKGLVPVPAKSGPPPLPAVPPDLPANPAEDITRKAAPASDPALSGKWQRIFGIIDRAGGPGLPLSRCLKARERRIASFNMWALVFGMFYYFAKGMWKKRGCYWV